MPPDGLRLTCRLVAPRTRAMPASPHVGPIANRSLCNIDQVDGIAAGLLSVLPQTQPVLLRRLVTEDAALYPDFPSAVTAEDQRLRFFGVPGRGALAPE